MDGQETMTALEMRLAELGASPQDHGTVELIVCRPERDQRRVLEQGELHLEDGLIGDNWKARGSSSTEDGRAHPDTQVTIMNSRVIRAITEDPTQWPLAGDQLYVDLDLSEDNLPSGQRIAIGSAILEVTAIPHTGCSKFTSRFGSDATRFVNSREGRQMHRRGINTRVIQPGVIRVGDHVTKLEQGS